MSYQVPGPCTLTFNGVSFSTSKAGITINQQIARSMVQHDAKGAQDAAIIFSGKSAIVSAQIIDTSPAISEHIVDGMFGYESNDGSEAAGTGPILGDAISVGCLASNCAKSLLIQERLANRGGNDYEWVAPLAVLLDPTELMMSATQELILNLQWLIVPYNNSGAIAYYELFTTVPSYLQA